VTILDTLPYREIWAVDFEFVPKPGERPDPVCLVARELRSGHTIRLWQDQFGHVPPYPIGPESLFVSFYASAELGCHRVLGWPMPARILDLFTEFRNCTNGLETPSGNGLIGALVAFGLDHIGVPEKKQMQAMFVRGGPWSASEREAGLDYCESDVDALARLLPAMLVRNKIDLPRALLRGRYMAAVSAMEHEGIPIDIENFSRITWYWSNIKDRLIAAIDDSYHVYEGRTFKVDRFYDWLARMGIPWPRHPSGQLDLTDETFRTMAKAYPAVSPLRELRSSLSSLHLGDLAVGKDGRNRCLLSPFQSRTSRNQPSNTEYIFGPSVWIRGLIKPPEGFTIAYVDWKQQEFGIAAALSGDQAMQAAYRSGDPYLTFAKQAGAAPVDATEKTHPDVRELFKACVLGIPYGMGWYTLATRIGGPPVLGNATMAADQV
jgi:hypothetical protein